MEDAFRVLEIATQHDAHERYNEASFLYQMACDMFTSIVPSLLKILQWKYNLD